MRPQAENVGIVGMEVYFPKEYVSQTALEQFDNVSAGKYTVGLGQNNMSVVNNNEDIVSMSLTVLKSLMEKYNLKPSDIGRLEVGTETLVDKSKAVKTYLMDLLTDGDEPNYDVVGCDTYNACYGGTNALFNAVNWIESRRYNGKYAVVITGDVAVYEPGPARATGGAGIVAMLLGPNAPITIDALGLTSYAENAYDFYKPNMNSEYPVVDGKLSNDCYLRATDFCYQNFAAKHQIETGQSFSMKKLNHMLYHSPYTKLVQKSFARMNYLDYKNSGEENMCSKLYGSIDNVFAESAPAEGLAMDERYVRDKTIEKNIINACKANYQTMVVPGLRLNQECGNMYTASVYASLCSLVSNKYFNTPKMDTLAKEPSKTGMFSYGSGLVASMFSVSLQDQTIAGRKELSEIAKKLDLEARLAQRVEITPEEFTKRLWEREGKYNHGVPTETVHYTEAAEMFPGTYFLNRADPLGRRFYQRSSTATAQIFAKPIHMEAIAKNSVKLLRAVKM